MNSQKAEISSDIAAKLRALATEWRDSPSRPHVSPELEHHWESLLAEWIDNPQHPLLVRRSGSRGSLLRHKTGRSIVSVDNAPANWMLSSALSGRRLSVANVMRELEEGSFPVALALKAEERKRATFQGTQRVKMDPPNLNTLGWKVCHIEPVAIGRQGAVEGMPIESLKSHMQRFLSVRNMFLVPKTHSGLGELPEFLEVFGRGGS